MDNSLKVGLIGAGKMGLLHGGIFNSLENSDLVCIAEKDKMISKGLGKYVPEVNVYRDYEKMLKKEDLDILAITTPVFLHKPMIDSALGYDLNIFIEKPLARTWEESKDIMKSKNNQKTLVGYCRRFMGTYKLAKKVIDQEVLGKINDFESQLYVSQCFDEADGWQYEPEKSGGGVLMDLGCHAIDLFHYLFGPINSVYGQAKSVYNKKVEDYVSMNMDFKKGFNGTLNLSWSIRNYRLPEFKIKIYFENGELIVTEKYLDIYSEIDTEFISEGWNTFYKQDITDDVQLNLGGPEYTLEDSHLVEAIIEDKKTKSNFKTAARTNLVLDRTYSSISDNEVKEINYGV